MTLEKAKNELVFLKDSEIYKPLGKDVVITKGSTVQAENFIDNISELPKDTTITFADEAPVTNVEIDKKEIKILVKYPDNSKSEIISTLTVSADNTQIVPLEIANIDITDAKMEIVKDAKKSFKLIYKDVRNQVIEKNDIVIDVMDVLDPSGTSITPSSSKMEVLQDYDDLSLLDIIICDGNLEPGTYTIILAVNQSKKEYSLPMEFYITHENNDPKKDEPPLVPSQPIEKDITENTMQEEISSIPKNQMSKIEEKKDEEKKDTVKEEIKSNLSSPKTGDTTQILLLLGILLGGFVLLLVLLYNKKKFNR
ncbi:MAG: Rib/alpha-like domain-containing protein [Acutalibacteraceae bacterium]